MQGHHVQTRNALIHALLWACIPYHARSLTYRWEGYVNHGGDGDERTLYANLQALSESVRAAAGDSPRILAHPASVGGGSVDAMLRTAATFNDKMHHVVRTLVMSMGAREFREGPIKKKERVEEKMKSDYGSWVLRRRARIDWGHVRWEL